MSLHPWTVKYTITTALCIYWKYKVLFKATLLRVSTADIRDLSFCFVGFCQACQYYLSLKARCQEEFHSTFRQYRIKVFIFYIRVFLCVWYVYKSFCFSRLFFVSCSFTLCHFLLYLLLHCLQHTEQNESAEHNNVS